MAKNNAKKTWLGYFTLRDINPIIRILTISDVMIISGYGLISPIFAIFIANSITGGSVEVVGIATAIYAVSQSVFQIPVALTIDKIKGERDDFWALLLGSICFSIIPLLYIIITTPLQLYFVQFIYGISTAATLPAWYAIFTRHVDKKHEAVEWGIYRTLLDLGGAATAFIGGFIAYHFSFIPLFVLVSIFSFIGTGFLLVIYRRLQKK